jgi:hydroxyethylthiazole kinase-like uncharacterized protein yjeF
MTAHLWSAMIHHRLGFVLVTRLQPGNAFREGKAELCGQAFPGQSLGTRGNSQKDSAMGTLSHFNCPTVPGRPDDGHKGTFGRVLLIGGSTGMSGSIALAAKAALRSGSGLVTAAVPTTIQSVVASFDPCYMTVGLPCEPDGQVQNQSLTNITRLVDRTDAVGIGPGLGQSDSAAQLLRSVIAVSDCPLVLDADALNLAAAHHMFEDESQRSSAIVVTPHPGEFARLTGMTTKEIAANRESAAAEFAARNDVIVVLKGAGTVVTDGKQLFVNDTGNSGMGTGGSGDVLTGVVTSLLGQGMAPLAAAALAVHVHGLAGDLAAGQFSERGMTALDLVLQLTAAWLSIESAR